jgi:hypothetical protein
MLAGFGLYHTDSSVLNQTSQILDAAIVILVSTIL